MKFLIKYREIIALIFLITLYLFLRIYHLEEFVNYSDDQGKILLSIYKIWTDKQPSLIGPPTSFSYEGRYFFHGPITYYLLLPALFLGNWQPLAGSYLIIFLNLLAVFIIYIATKKIANSFAGFIASLSFAIYPDTIYYTTFIWNPNFLPLISSLVLLLLVGLGKFNKTFPFLLVGFLLGLGIQFHYQVILLTLVLSIYLIVKKKMNMRSLILFLVGIFIGYSPMIIFELRHQFYNTKTIILLLTHGVFFDKSTSPAYYFLSFLPFIFTGIGILVSKIYQQNKSLTGFLILVLAVIFLLSDYQQIITHKGMPKNWQYQNVEEAAQIISNQNIKNFNIVNLLSGDTRFNSLRYLLVIAKHSPLNVEEYPNANHLFVVSKLGKREVENYPVWEIQSFKPFHIQQQWNLKNNFYLYQLDKN